MRAHSILAPTLKAAAAARAIGVVKPACSTTWRRLSSYSPSAAINAILRAPAKARANCIPATWAVSTSSGVRCINALSSGTLAE